MGTVINIAIGLYHSEIGGPPGGPPIVKWYRPDAMFLKLLICIYIYMAVSLLFRDIILVRTLRSQLNGLYKETFEIINTLKVATSPFGTHNKRETAIYIHICNYI